MKVLFSLIVFCACLACSTEKGSYSRTPALGFSKEYTILNGVLHKGEKPFTGAYETFHLNDSISERSSYLDGLKQGEFKAWYQNGKLASKRYYSKGLKNGVHNGWWEDGEPKFRYHFNAEGNHEGELKEWFNDGELSRFFHHKNGKEEGSQKAWKADGRIRANYVVRNGERYGLIGLKRCYTVYKEDTLKQQL